MTKREQIINDYFSTMDALRRLSVGPHQVWQSAPNNITRAQFGVLIMISFHKLNTVKQLADHLGISSSATTQMVNGLVTLKLLDRTHNDQDRRSVILTLTTKGQAMLKKKKQAMQASLRTMFTPLSDKELAQLTNYQKKILNYFRAHDTK